jgi:hypothetical protein
MMTNAVANLAKIGVSFSTGCTVHFLYMQPGP